MMPNLTPEQRDILYHTVHRAAGGLYCGGSPEMDALVAAGLMEYAGRKSFVPDPYYRITGKGREALRSHEQTISAGNNKSAFRKRITLGGTKEPEEPGSPAGNLLGKEA